MFSKLITNILPNNWRSDQLQKSEETDSKDELKQIQKNVARLYEIDKEEEDEDRELMNEWTVIKNQQTKTQKQQITNPNEAQVDYISSRSNFQNGQSPQKHQMKQIDPKIIKSSSFNNSSAKTKSRTYEIQRNSINDRNYDEKYREKAIKDELEDWNAHDNSEKRIKENRKFPKKPSKYDGIDLNYVDKSLLFSSEHIPLSENEWKDCISLLKDVRKISRDRLKLSLVKGIPPHLRGDIWCLLCNHPFESLNHDPRIYVKLLSMTNENDSYNITKDLDRTLPELKLFNQDYKTGKNTLYNVLKAYSCYDNEIGYVQGMNYVAAILLIQIKDEIKTFWCLNSLLHRKNWRMIYNNNTPKLVNLLELVRQRVASDDPILLRHIESQGLSMVSAFAPIFISLFTYQVPLPIATRIFEYFIFEGETALLRVLFKMLQYKREKIISLDECELQNYLRAGMIVECAEELKIEELLDY
ncbi:ecotropic viral integration site 5 protein homolog [Stylonychia lemnae]|uniref:Ecotropic viral integration site 5 protein homolog n=1 Tax=Stylonychia lemnae TaxID=5949 RepID=A0A077ZQM2_STYLE|nr:ecotropic viral integration site 5 protein homolog [Stylonychia lemnae]|eukprot:CDW72223.1 ecotropic viral integration site 5 protein homolog [Stylonychia lemnae]